MTTALEIKNLSISFINNDKRTDAVKNFSMQINHGEVVALVGESGSGKSVSALSAMRLLDDSGVIYGENSSIIWQGQNILHAEKKALEKMRGKDIGMIFQEPMTSLNPTWTCGKQIDEALEIHTNLNASDRKKRVISLLKDVGLTDPEQRYDRYPYELSGGMRQRVCIAIALACNPKLLIADEPTTALDVTVQSQILELLLKLQKERGMSVLFITHDLGVVAEIANKIVVLWNGEKVEEGSVHDIFNSPKHNYTKGLLACRPLLSKMNFNKKEKLPTVADFVE